MASWPAEHAPSSPSLARASKSVSGFQKFLRNHLAGIGQRKRARAKVQKVGVVEGHIKLQNRPRGWPGVEPPPLLDQHRATMAPPPRQGEDCRHVCLSCSNNVTSELCMQFVWGLIWHDSCLPTSVCVSAACAPCPWLASSNHRVRYTPPSYL